MNRKKFEFSEYKKDEKFTIVILTFNELEILLIVMGGMTNVKADKDCSDAISTI